jgi:hypothetical protein
MSNDVERDQMAACLGRPERVSNSPSVPLATNDQVNRAKATASTEAQNADAASVVPTPTTEDGGSGSTHGSFSYFLLEPLE